jgi:hypothetical protein
MRLSITGRHRRNAQPAAPPEPTPLELYEAAALDAVARCYSGLGYWQQVGDPRQLVDALLDVRNILGQVLAPKPVKS